ncbi:MAG TPA: zinc ribbon domain-containing protein [Candidatus Dormibacteraeota bacterium]|nr:zinc ribbon domain-containing protein [Candidatus Dormibacteraeota bacterium]
MPLYEYRCESCGKRTSALLPRFDAPDPACPHCGAQALRRLISTFATSRGRESGPEAEDDPGGDEGEFGADDLDDDW